jgi:hypothetical protein
MSIPESYLQTSWGESFDDVTMDDVQSAIEETIDMDDKHCVFWVGIFVGDNEIVLETRKNMTVLGIFNDAEEEEIEAKFEDWEDIEELYELFLAKDFEQVQSILKAQ